MFVENKEIINGEIRPENGTNMFLTNETDFDAYRYGRARPYNNYFLHFYYFASSLYL